jgi:hypothetical protein
MLSPVRGGRGGDSYEFGMWEKGRRQRSSAVWFNVNQEREYKKLMDCNKAIELRSVGKDC